MKKASSEMTAFRSLLKVNPKSDFEDIFYEFAVLRIVRDFYTKD